MQEVHRENDPLQSGEETWEVKKILDLILSGPIYAYRSIIFSVYFSRVWMKYG